MPSDLRAELDALKVAVEPDYTLATSSRMGEAADQAFTPLRDRIAALTDLAERLLTENERLRELLDDQMAHGLQNPGSHPRCSAYEKAESIAADYRDTLRDIQRWLIDGAGTPTRRAMVTVIEDVIAKREKGDG